MKKLNITSTITTNKGIYSYEKLLFTAGEKRLNPKIAKKNLLDFKRVMTQHKLQFGLIYGTLLGAIREGDFIEHDEDTDLFLLLEDQERILDTLFELRKIGFEVGRYNGELLTVTRDGEYIDIYFFKKRAFHTRECDGYVIKEHFLTQLEEYPFLGEIFLVPHNPEELLVSLYGESWRIPDKEGSTINYGLSIRFRSFLRDHVTPLFNLLSWTKHKFFTLKVV
jgi:phosphorylcholine metabolism protein LicD